MSIIQKSLVVLIVLSVCCLTITESCSGKCFGYYDSAQKCTNWCCIPMLKGAPGTCRSYYSGGNCACNCCGFKRNGDNNVTIEMVDSIDKL
jgi:hypothetical protein